MFNKPESKAFVVKKDYDQIARPLSHNKEDECTKMGLSPNRRLHFECPRQLA